MARYKDYSYSQGIMIPVYFTKQIVSGILGHTIHWLVDNKIDLSRMKKSIGMMLLAYQFVCRAESRYD
jgi:hypothetical protein